MRSAVVLTVLLASTITTSARAQCADGTTSCRSVATPAPKRLEVPLDDKTWIVVPFDNTRRDPEIDWLREGSMNLLATDLSRWTDVKVVDEKRVSDFVRDVPSAASQRLTLNDGLAVARRAGAGQLVMGDILRIGPRATVTATVYNARTGARVRSAREDAAVADSSILAAYGRLARGVVNYEPPAGTSLDAAGTRSIGAYQEYLLGNQALNQFRIPEARQHYEKALALDSTFAMAHYKLAVSVRYDDAERTKQLSATKAADALSARPVTRASMDSIVSVHAAGARAFSASLPARERGLITGLVAMSHEDFPAACAAYGSLVKSDSSDVEALYALGDCQLRNDIVEAVGGDTTRLRFVSDWNVAHRVLKRAIAIDPSFHLAFDDLLTVLLGTRRGCLPTAETPCTTAAARAPGGKQPRAIYADVAWEGDSLHTTPLVGDPTSSQVIHAMTAGPGHAAMEQALAAARAWIDAGPREARAYMHAASILTRLGRLPEADSAVTMSARLSGAAVDPSVPMIRMEIALKRGHATDAARILDSVFAAQHVGLMGTSAGMLSTPFGRLRRGDSTLMDAMVQGMRLSGAPIDSPQLAPIVDALRTYMHQATLVTVGVGGDSAVVAESKVLQVLGKPGAKCVICASLAAPMLFYGIRLPRTTWPDLGDSLVKGDPRFGPAAALAEHDTTALIAAAARLDSASAAQVKAFLPDDGSAFIAADAYLVARDTAHALGALRRMLDTQMVSTPMPTVISPAGAPLIATLWPRAMLLRADLATATGQKVEARTWYVRYIDAFGTAESPLQPSVTRARAALTALGPPGR